MIGELYRGLSPVSGEKLCFRRNLQLAMDLDRQPPAVAAVLQGANIVRVHDVKATVEACRLVDEIAKSRY